MNRVKKVLAVILLMAIEICPVFVAAEAHTIPDMTSWTVQELSAMSAEVSRMMSLYHETNSRITSEIESMTKNAVEIHLNKKGYSTVSWPWFDYDYTNNWGYYTLTTRVTYGNHTDSPVYAEAAILSNNQYSLVFLKVDGTLLIDRRDEVDNEYIFGKKGDPDEDENAVVVDDTVDAVEIVDEENVLLKMGTNSDEVKNIKTWLKELGYYKGVASNSYEKDIKTAVEAWQKANGIRETGYVTNYNYVWIKQQYENMSGALENSPKSADTPAPTQPVKTDDQVLMEKGTKSNEVKQVQTWLITLGYLDDKADGSFGKKTETAVKAWQKANGLEQTGTMTQKEYDQLQKQYKDYKPAPTKAPTPTKTPMPTPSIPTYTAKKLHEFYEENEIAADNELKKRTIEVTGKIYKISEDLWGNPLVYLYADNYGFKTVDCYFPSSAKSKVAKLKKDSTVTIRGECRGMNIIDPYLEKCEIVQ